MQGYIPQKYSSLSYLDALSANVINQKAHEPQGLWAFMQYYKRLCNLKQLHHAAHAAHAAHTAAHIRHARCVILWRISDHAFGGDHQTCD